LTKTHALDHLKFSKQIYEIAHYLNSGSIQLLLPKNHKEAKFNSPLGSFLSLHYPFSTDKALSQKYNKFDSGELRVGKIMEIMDALAADVSYKYITNTPIEEEAAMVTVVVDNIYFERPLSSEHDLLLSVIYL
jgi:hypothetical protein